VKKTFQRTPIASIRSALVAMLLIIWPVHAAQAGPGCDGSADDDASQATWSSPLIFFQRVISRADGDRCPMAPSCSHYAATVFKKHHPVTAWVLTCDRLLRCGHDEVRLSPRVWAGGRWRAFDPVSANTFWWRKP
jgi:hypothetical protein